MSICASFFLIAGQAISQSPAFDAVSIRESPGTGNITHDAEGGPGTRDPGLFTCRACFADDLVFRAYAPKSWELIMPDGLGDHYFDITARIRNGATKDEFRLMLQKMLADRFGVRIHRELRTVPVYDLVAEKSGVRLKQAGAMPAVTIESLPPAQRPVNGIAPIAIGKDGYPAPWANFEGAPSLVNSNGRNRMQLPNSSMDKFAENLSSQVGRPVRDRTGLTGSYDIALYWIPDYRSDQSSEPNVAPSSASSDPGPDIVTALRTQLGLRLVPDNGQINALVVDRVNMAPTEN